MKILSASLMVVTALSINLAPVRAVDEQVEINTNNESHYQENKNYTYPEPMCIKFPMGFIICM